MSTIKEDIENLVIHISDTEAKYKFKINGAYTDRYLDGSILKFAIGLKVLLIALYLVIWVILVIFCVKLNYARKFGKRLQEECGNEHLEIETPRFAIYEAHQAMKHYFVTNMNLFATILFLVLVLSFLEVFQVYKIFKITNTTGAMIVNQWFMIIVCLLFFFVFLSAWISEISVFSTRITTKYNNRIAPSVQKGLTATLRIMSLTVILFIVFFGGLFYYYGIKTHIWWYIITACVTSFLLHYYFWYFVNLHNNSIVPYSKASSELNKYIEDKLKSSKERILLTNYLSQNIRRTNPDIDTMPDLTQYKDKYYQYVMHKNGRETLNENTNSIDIPISTLKAILQPILFANIASITDVQAFKTDIEKVRNNLKAITYVTSNSSIKYTTVGEYVRKWFVTLIKTVVKSDEDIRATRETIHKAIDMYAFGGDFIVHESGGPAWGTGISTTDSGTKNAIKAKFTKAEYNIKEVEEIWNIHYLTSGIVVTKETSQDVTNLIAIMADSYGSNTISYDAISSNIINSTLEPEVINLIEDQIRKYKSGLMVSTLQDYMITMRKLDAPMQEDTGNMIFIIIRSSLVVFFVFSFLLFHKLYQSAKEETKMVVALVMLIFIAIAAWYSWFMGNVL
jgi:hypothetical protein